MTFKIPTFLLMSCFGAVAASESSHSPLDDDEGYLVMALYIDGRVPNSIKLRSQALFGRSDEMSSLKQGQNFKLVKLAAGKYSWDRINVNNVNYFDLRDQSFDITVHARKINYGGHFMVDINDRFNTATFNYVNRSSEVIDYLKNCCEALNQRYPLVFSVDSVDPFIEFYTHLTAGADNKGAQ